MERLIDADVLEKAIESTEFESIQDSATILQLVTECPTAEAASVVHGKWIKKDGTFECSVCGQENQYAYSHVLKMFTDKYCPACGVKMRI